MIAAAELSRARSDQAWEYENPVPGGVVVGVDGSRPSIAALNTGAAIARRRRCPLHAVTVLSPFPSYHIVAASEESGENVNVLRKKLRDSELRDIVRVLEPADDWTHEVRMGRPARELTLVAENRAADLMVVGRHHHGAVDRALGGETVLQIMRMSSVPVLAVDSDLETPRTIVCGMDFSPSSILAAKTALQLMNGSGTLYLVFVDSNRLPGDPVTRFRRVIDEDLVHRAAIHVEPVVLNGRPASAVIQFAERVGADLICAGSHGHGRLERFVLGSVSTGIVLNSDRAVMVVPSRS